MKNAQKKTAQGCNPERSMFRAICPETNLEIIITQEPQPVKGEFRCESDRISDLWENFCAETNDPESEEWRNDLTDEEARMVSDWDNRYNNGVLRLCEAILERGVQHE